MKKLMKFAAASVVAMGVGITANAQATVFYSGTVSGWTTVSDADGDSTWTNNSYDPALANAHVTLTETELLGQDTYTAAYDLTPLAGGGILSPNSYAANFTGAITTPSNEHFATASSDSTVIPGQTSTIPQVADALTTITNGDGSTTTLDSINGFPVAPAGINGQTITVNEKLTSSGGLLTNASSTFNVAVPEPGSILLLGIGLTALVIGRQKLAMGAF